MLEGREGERTKERQSERGSEKAKKLEREWGMRVTE